MSAKLIHDKLSYSVIGAFFEVYHTLGFGFLEHVYVASLGNYLRATTLELGLLLHFGPRPKFYRVICSNPVARAPKPPFSRIPLLPRAPRNPTVVEGSRNAVDLSVIVATSNAPGT